jgi:hypothetical protein
VRLLNRSVHRPLAPPAALAIARATGGNPLALIDLAGESLVHELPDLGISDEPVPIGRHLEEHYVRRVRQADASVQRWVLLAAADSTGNVDLLSDAARALGLEPDDADRAELAGLLSLTPAVQFRHPLVRSAVYNAASGPERRHAHHALARAADRLGLVEAEAWHAARAVVGTDEAVADRLAHTADLAARRGGLASRASILARAAELTPPGPAREDRQAAAAEAALAAGAAHVAKRLVEESDLSAAGPVAQGRVTLVRSGLGMFVGDADGVRGATAAVPGGGPPLPRPRRGTRAARSAAGVRDELHGRVRDGRRHARRAGSSPRRRRGARAGAGRDHPAGAGRTRPGALRPSGRPRTRCPGRSSRCPTTR